MELLSQLSFNQNKAQQKILTQLSPPLLFPHSDFHYLYQVDEGVHPPNLDLGGWTSRYQDPRVIWYEAKMHFIFNWANIEVAIMHKANSLLILKPGSSWDGTRICWPRGSPRIEKTTAHKALTCPCYICYLQRTMDALAWASPAILAQRGTKHHTLSKQT